MANLFKGFILTSNKEPLTSIKSENFFSEPPPEHDYAGVLRDEIIQLDFDDEETSQKVLEIVNEYKLRCDILETTRGIHLYFLNDSFTTSQSVGIFNAMGIKCDVGLGNKFRVIPLRTTKKIPIKKMINGVEIIEEKIVTNDRQWIQKYDDIEVIPPYLRPFGKYDYKFPEVEARNQTLFEYILQLQFKGYNKDEVRKTIKAINKFMLYEPLSDREIDTITRDEAFSEELFYTEKGGFLHHKFGDYMLANSNILVINQQPHIYTDSHLYSNDQNEFEKQMLVKIPSLKDTQRKEVYKYIALKANRKADYSEPKYVGLKDNIIDIETMQQINYSPKWVINNKVEYNYNPNVYSEVMDKTLDKVACGDKQIRLLLEEMIGYTLYRANSMQKCFILTGEGSNGKSTILNIIKRLLGKQNYTSLDLRELEETFTPAELANKLANIGDDISSKYLDSSSVFKKVVTGESFMVQKKYAQPFELESYATQIFCANELPQVSDKSDGFSRRIIIIPFNAKFSKNDPDYDPFIESKLLSDESMEYLLKIAIEGLRRVIVNKEFTKSDVGEAEKKEYSMYNNNVLEWLETEPLIENHEVANVYLQYSVWCSRNGTHAVKKMNLSKAIKREKGLVSKPKSIDGKTVRVYVKG